MSNAYKDYKMDQNDTFQTALIRIAKGNYKNKLIALEALLEFGIDINEFDATGRIKE